jgi:hypothetical protein
MTDSLARTFSTFALSLFAALGSPPTAAAQDIYALGFDSLNPPSAEYIERANQQLPPRPEFFLGPRWPGPQGSPRVVTWSFVPDGVVVPSIIGENGGTSSLFARMDFLFAAQGGRATWVQRVQQSFDRWEELTGIDFQRLQASGVDWDDGASWGSLGSATRGDIRLAMKRLDGPGGVTVVAAFPGNGDIVLDRFDAWESAGDLNRVLRNSLMWAQGIACGVDLACPADATKLMEPVIPFQFDGPQQDDVRAMQRHYGDPFEADDSPGAAAALGTIPIGSSVALGALPPPLSGANPPHTAWLSIDADGETDHFSFEVTSPAVANVTLTPIGSVYELGPNGGGGCQGSAPFDALAAANLDLELLASDGVTLLASAAANGAGAAENLLLAPLNSAGTYFVRVLESGTPGAPQGYSLQISISSCTLDSDGDGVADCNDGCPFDPLKTAAGVCGCGVSDSDSDGDGVADCNDGCPLDPLKTSAGFCGCGVPETDSDGDGAPDCNDGCPNDPLKTEPGQCGCGVSDLDSDGDGTADCVDGCPADPLKTAPGICGCGTPDSDSDGDGVEDCNDGCPNDPLKTEPGLCGCGVSDLDSDGDGEPNCSDGCPNDPFKIAPGTCGCGTPDVDSDGDGVLDCLDGCPDDPLKSAPGVCGCGVSDDDSDGDGVADCLDGCPNDPLKTAPGLCGCGVSDLDSDGDSIVDCLDNCPSTPNALQEDSDGDGRGDACDNCPDHVNPGQDDCDGDSFGDLCTIVLGLQPDCDQNGVPDNCEPDCNGNGQVDACDILLGSSLDSNANTVPDDCEAPCPAIQTYCTAKLNSQGCFPAMGWSGTPSLTAGSGFTITCTQAIPDRSGQLFYGYAASFAPFQGGFLCVRPPLRRTGVMLSTGAGVCGGVYARDFNVWLAGGADMVLTPGMNVFARWWMRDPQAQFTTGFSDALTFTVCP